jgi:glycosyltransferase involved in cell wall biosynthesis
MALERLTVLLPVRDAQSTLISTVTEVLEVASDLTDRLELLIIDDGSADATIEVAEELSRHYPQVRTVRHIKPMGHDAALRTGLAQSNGEVVVVRQGKGPTLERLHRASRPSRPNYLGRTRQFVSDEI